MKICEEWGIYSVAINRVKKKVYKKLRQRARAKAGKFFFFKKKMDCIEEKVERGFKIFFR